MTDKDIYGKDPLEMCRGLPSELLQYREEKGSDGIFEQVSRDASRLRKGAPSPLQDSLVTDNLRLVSYIAKRFTDRGIELADLISTGYVGLVKAARCFDDSYGCKFSTFAAKCIENEIRYELKRENKKIRCLSIDAGTDGDGLRPADIAYEDSSLTMLGEKEALCEAVLSLPHISKEIIYLLYLKYPCLSAIEAAAHLGVSRQDVYKRRKRALCELRDILSR